MEHDELYAMVDMLKTAINQDREFTADESKKFNDLFENAIDNKLKNQLAN